jgi:hypothetical protein
MNDERPWPNINKLPALSGRPGLELRWRPIATGH